jgi:hypothetical protein
LKDYKKKKSDINHIITNQTIDESIDLTDVIDSLILKLSKLVA